MNNKLALIVVGLFMANFASLAQAERVSSSASINISITKLPSPLIVKPFKCSQGTCAIITADNTIMHVVCETRPDQASACLYSPE